MTFFDPVHFFFCNNFLEYVIPTRFQERKQQTGVHLYVQHQEFIKTRKVVGITTLATPTMLPIKSHADLARASILT